MNRRVALAEIGADAGADAGTAVPLAARLLHARLRQDTGDSHERVERAFDLAAAAATAQAGTYRAALDKLHLAYLAIQRELRSPAVGDCAEAQRHAELQIERLQHDLRAFGSCEAGIEPSSFALADGDEALGCEYVMRGSALGGLVIFKLAAARLDITRLRGGRFFWGDGRATQATWSAFQERLSPLSADGATADRIVHGAIKTFRHFEATLATRGSE